MTRRDIEDPKEGECVPFYPEEWRLCKMETASGTRFSSPKGLQGDAELYAFVT